MTNNSWHAPFPQTRCGRCWRSLFSAAFRGFQLPSQHVYCPSPSFRQQLGLHRFQLLAECPAKNIQRSSEVLQTRSITAFIFVSIQLTTTVIRGVRMFQDLALKSLSQTSFARADCASATTKNFMKHAKFKIINYTRYIRLWMHFAFYLQKIHNLLFATLFKQLIC